MRRSLNLAKHLENSKIAMSSYIFSIKWNTTSFFLPSKKVSLCDSSHVSPLNHIIIYIMSLLKVLNTLSTYHSNNISPNFVNVQLFTLSGKKNITLNCLQGNIKWKKMEKKKNNNVWIKVFVLANKILFKYWYSVGRDHVRQQKWWYLLLFKSDATFYFVTAKKPLWPAPNSI